MAKGFRHAAAGGYGAFLEESRSCLRGGFSQSRRRRAHHRGARPHAIFHADAAVPFSEALPARMHVDDLP